MASVTDKDMSTLRWIGEIPGKLNMIELRTLL